MISKTHLTCWILVAFEVTAWSGCASPGNHSPPQDASSDSASRLSHPLKPGKVEIRYVLGHSHRKFEVQGEEGRYQAASSMDGQILKKSEITPQDYEEFLLKVNRLVQALPPQKKEDCRSPYYLILHQDGAVVTRIGCRGEDDGALGRLLREGEFLLHARHAH